MTAPIVRAIRRRPVVIDIHEDYSAVLSDRQWAHGLAEGIARCLVAVATKVATCADLTVVADEHLPPLKARWRLVQQNRPDPSLLPPVTRESGSPRAIYIGDLRRTRGLFDMLDAIAAAPEWSLDLVGPVASDDVEMLTQRLDGPLGQRVRVHGRLPPAEAWSIAEGAWVGFALLQDTTAFRAAIPSKLYEYLACGIPAVTSDLPRVRPLIEATGAGVLVPTEGPSQTVTALLQEWARNPEKYRPVRERAEAASEAHRSADGYVDFASSVMSLLGR
jgi:glycosyltransferase involved in cell wall biosynthesis